MSEFIKSEPSNLVKMGWYTETALSYEFVSTWMLCKLLAVCHMST